MPENMLEVTVGDGKYTVIQGPERKLRALRYGKEWRDCCGDGLIHALACEVSNLRVEVKRLEAESEFSHLDRDEL